MRLVLRSTAHLVAWICAHYALEWLFFVTKPSVISAAPWRIRWLILLAAPAIALLLFVPAQLLLSGLDALRRNARAYWLAALLPAIATVVLTVIAVDNFTRTVIGLGIIDTRNNSARFYALVVLVFAIWLWRREARELARPRGPWRAAIPAAVLIVAAAAGESLCKRDTPPPPRELPRARLQPAQRPNILIIGIDSVMADHASVYGYYRRTTPTLEALAARGLLFENAFSNAGRTYGSLISINTGKLPSVTRTIFPPAYLTGRDAVEHLPGILREAGYTTAQLGMRHYSDADAWNLRGGYDVINGRAQSTLEPDRSDADERLTRHRNDVRERIRDRALHLAVIRYMEDDIAFLVEGKRSVYFSDKLRVRLAEEFILARREPWMVHVHLTDPHCCADTYGTPDIPWADRASVPGWINIYDDVFREADRKIAGLLRVLEQAGARERTMLVIYSDHTRDWRTHGRLPLLIVPAGGVTPRRIKANAQVVDIAPTILDSLGLPKPQWMNGQSLLRPEQLDPRRPLFSLVQLAQTSVSGPGQSIIVNAGPPHYGVSTAGIVICDRGLELHFDGTKAWHRDIKDHTAPCGDPPLGEEARELLLRHLRANGFTVDGSRPWSALTLNPRR